ncbi:DUF6771 family protein [Sphingomonas sp. Leaf257]|jgi:hypothetical protein|uniref:DUF6771 family protein n=1 Tax=Sphingomonas sp. Leaf257 TaxID=1736309 RepID=UPI001F252937|nr:DUF6771 family protein [Sphingomonas sp. Leaf257]
MTLAESFAICSHVYMERIDPQQISDALLNSAGWARIGLTAPVQRIREQAAKELALTICEMLDPSRVPDRNQLALPL